MRLFFQLNEDEQNYALKHCTNIIVEDIIDGGIVFEPMTDEEASIKQKIDDAVKHIAKFDVVEDKVNYLLNDDVIARTIYDLSLEMAKSAFYHEQNELVIYTDLKDAEEEPVEQKETKKYSDLN